MDFWRFTSIKEFMFLSSYTSAKAVRLYQIIKGHVSNCPESIVFVICMEIIDSAFSIAVF